MPRDLTVLQGQAALLAVDAAGGSIANFHLLDQPLNPLSWGTPQSGDAQPRGYGHFLCLDRWGAPTEAESAQGMPFHGEASRVPWEVSRGAVEDGDLHVAMGAKLPLAGLSIRRVVRLSRKEAFFTVREEITNGNRLGRVYNVVQHATIGPDFLDGTTLVDSNARRGFAQGGSLPDPEEPSFHWPQAVDRDGEAVNLRRFTSEENTRVVSYTIDDGIGWVTAATPWKGLLIGWFWRTAEYPWLNFWRAVRGGKPAARGLEFGTTGLHQPYTILTRKGRIFGRPLFEYLDAGETAVKEYAGFLLQIPADWAGVQDVRVEKGRLTVRQRAGGNGRDLALCADGWGPSR